jgi:hypothetical protein
MEHIKRHRRQQALIQSAQDISLVLQTATPGIDQHRCAERSPLDHSGKQALVENVACVRCQRQQHHKDIGRCEKRPKAVLPGKTCDAVGLLRGSRPSRDVEAETAQFPRGIHAKFANPHDAHGDVARRALFAVFFPDPGCLLRPVLWSETLMIQHLPDHIFAHPSCQIRRNRAHNRHIRQAGGRKDVINTGPKRENRFEVGQFRQGRSLGFPNHRIFDLWVGFPIGCKFDRALRRGFRKLLYPDAWIPARKREQDMALGCSIVHESPIR